MKQSDVLNCIVATIFFIFIGNFESIGQTLNPSSISTNGTVNVIVQDSTTIYIGGNFSAAGYKAGGIAKINIDARTSSEFPSVSGYCYSTVSDGNGGWYVGGNFVVQGLSNLVHILPDNTIDISFTPNPINTVNALFYDGSTLYVGGVFTQISSQTQSYLAAISGTTGALLPWNPNADGVINTINKDGNIVYVGGYFDNIGGKRIRNLAALDAVTALSLPFISASAPVTSIEKDANNFYVTGNFSGASGFLTGANAIVSTTSDLPDFNFPKISGFVAESIPDGNGGWYVGGNFVVQGLSNLVHILPDNTIDASFAPNPSNTVNALFYDGSTLYVGGVFTQISSQTQSHLAAISGTTGALLPWNPNADGVINTINKDGSIVYVGGYFDNIGGKRIRNLAALDAVTALSLPFISASAPVTSIEKDANNFYVTGNFSGASGFLTGANAIVSTTSDLPDFNFPKISGFVAESIPDGNGGWYVGGNFVVQGLSNLVHILPDNTIDASFTPNPSNTVNALFYDGSTLYVGGVFTQISSQTQSHLAAINGTTGALLPWNPNADGVINTINKDGSIVYVGGYFDNIGGKKIRNLAALDAVTALSLPFISASAPVTSIEKDANNFYVTGNFSGASGFLTGANAIVSTTSDLPDFNFPKIIGQIHKSIPDGNGGWYVGGDFVVQGLYYLVHILANYTIDTSFSPNPNGSVYALNLDGSTLYVGGNFTQISGQSQNFIAAINGTTGVLQSWNPNSDGSINTITKVGSIIYVGGSFTNIGGQSRNNIAALDSSSALAISWNPNINSTVKNIVINGSEALVCGSFAQIGLQSRNYLAAVSLSTGIATSWNPSPDGPIDSIELNGTNVYIGGNFFNIGGQPRNYIAEVSLSNSTATAWNPSANGRVNCLKLIDTTIYAGGEFTTIGGQPRNYFAALNNITGNASAYNPAPSQRIHDIAVNGTSILISGAFEYLKSENRNYLMSIARSNSLITSWNPSPSGPIDSIELNGANAYIGGAFAYVGGQPRNYIAEISLSTSNATSWNPNPNNRVRAIKSIGTTVYAGGDFSTIGGQARNYLAALNNTNGNATTWNAAPSSTVYSMAVNGSSISVAGYFEYTKSENRNYLMSIAKSNSLITSWNPSPDGPIEAIEPNGANAYIGGSFTNAGGQPRNYIAEINLTTGMASTWNPNANNRVRAIKSIGTTVYAGGDFTAIGGQPRSYLAALNNTNGIATTWNAAPSSTVYSMAVNDSSISVAGYFEYTKSENRNYLMSIAKSNSLITSWNPSPDGPIEAIEPNGANAYIGGSFTNAGGQPRNYIAEINLTTGMASTWNPNANNRVRALKLIGSTVYAGGDFATIGGQSRTYIAALNNTNGNATNWNPKADASVNKINQSNTDIIASGNFTFMNSELRGNLMAVSKETGLITSWNPNPNSTIETIKLSGNNAYVGGSFNSIGGQPRNSIANISLTTGNATIWNPNANANVKTIELFGNTVYAGGSFTSIGGQARNNIAALNVANNNATSWNPNPNGPITKLAVSDSIVYVAGEYSNIAGQSRNRLSSFKILDGSLNSWNPDVNGYIYDLQITGSNIYIGGSFSEVTGQARSNIASFNKSLGVLRNWKPLLNGTVTALSHSGKFIYAGGSFTSSGGQTCSGFTIINANTAFPELFFPTVTGQINTFSGNANQLYIGGSFTSINGINFGGLASLSYPASTFTPTVEDVTPNSGGIGGDIAVSIIGMGFIDGSSVAFIKSGETDINIPASSTIISDNNRLTVILDLHEPVSLGFWDIRIDIPGQNSIIIENGFEVLENSPISIQTNILGFSSIRPNVWQSYTVSIQNNSTHDISGVPIHIAIDSNVDIDFISEIRFTDDAGNLIYVESTPNFTPVENLFGSASTMHVYSFLLGNIGTLQTGYINFKLRTQGTNFSIKVWNDNPIYGSLPLIPAWGLCALSIFDTVVSLTPAGCPYGIIRAALDPAIKAAAGVTEAQPILIDFFAGMSKAVLGCITLSDELSALFAVRDIFRKMYNFAGGVDSANGIYSSCSPFIPPTIPDQSQVNVIASFDPNDKTGPTGSGDERYVQPSKIVPYIIRCENFEDATAAAQRVRIVDEIDQSVFDLSTFQLGFISIRDSIIPVPSGLKHYETDVDLRPLNNIIARIVADLDMTTGIATWTFTSIDPLTLLETENPFAGFLPPNINKPEGEAAVMFTIETLPTISHDTQIRNDAAIYFDTNPPIITNEWLNTSDIIKPVSQMTAAPTRDNLTINLTWSGSDVGSGVRSYAIYYSKNGQPFEILKDYVIGNTYSFDGEADQSYSFFTIATDNVGNIEDMKTLGEGQIALGINQNELLTGVSIYPNPNNGSFTLFIDSKNSELVSVTITDLLGRNINSEKHDLLIGPNHIPLKIDKNGIYFVRIDNKKSKIVKKVIINN